MKHSYWKRSLCAVLALMLFGTFLIGSFPAVAVADTTVQEDKKDYDNLKNQMGSINNRLNQRLRRFDRCIIDFLLL